MAESEKYIRSGQPEKYLTGDAEDLEKFGQSSAQTAENVKKAQEAVSERQKESNSDQKK